MLRPVVVTAAVWATCTKQQAVYKEATRKGGLFCLGAQFRALGGRPACSGSPRIHAGEFGFQAERLA